MRIHAILLAVAVAALPVHPALAVTADELVARHIEARGGMAKLTAIQSLKLSGKATASFRRESSPNLVWVRLLKRPGMIRTETSMQGLTAITAYDGKTGWRVQPFRGRRTPERMSADELKALELAADLDGPLVNWRAKGYALRYLGTEDVDGTDAHKLELTRRGDRLFVYLDPNHFLTIRIESRVLVRGAEVVEETDLGNYELVAGVYVPFAVESGPKGGGRVQRVLVERAEANVAVDDALLRFPEGAAAAPALAATPPLAAAPTGASPAPAASAPPPARFDAGVLSGIGARNIGSAAMSGRIAALAAYNEGGKTTVYVGAASGGVWKSVDGGTTFKPVFDRSPVQSIGALAVDPTNRKNVWVGTGEAWTRNSVSIGDGIYKSADGGESWQHAGLRESERVAAIVVHPKNGDVVYACVPGKLWSDSAERGLYKTADGGKTWTLILRGPNPSTGCSSLGMDPENPEVLLAGLWDFRRQGWTFRSGGDGQDAPSGSGMFRTADGGKTWVELTARSSAGLPDKPWGRTEVVFAPSDPRVVYAFVESKDPALYRSSDGGKTWEARDKSQNMVWRPFYFAKLIVDPRNPERVFKTNLQLIVSDDGGKSFASVGGAAHGDWHDVWINPDNTQHLIGGDDGGLWISYDGGNRWWRTDNLPISQFYHVTADDKDPYQVYGGTQDNSTWVGDTAYPRGITSARWENLYGGDGFWAVIDPSDPEAVYVESQGGRVGRIDRRTRASRPVQPLPGYREKLRFNWNTPIHASPTDRRTIYLGAQFLFRSRDRGDTWERISPDLTTNDPEKQKQELSGGITVDNSSAEMHTSIYSISESPKNNQVIWVGTDDGNLQLTRNGGKTWTNVAPRATDLPPASWVAWVEAGRFDAATAYAAFDRHTVGDMTPYVYRTTDYGKTWTRIAGPGQGLRGYVHVVKEDVVQPSLLFVGTELGLWVSVDGGASWAEFKGGGFPSVAVRDLYVHPREHDLIIGTHGRGIWIVDDVTPLRGLSAATLAREAAFAGTRPVQQRLDAVGGWSEGDARFLGDNPPGGAVITYYLRERHLFGPLKLEVLDAGGKVLDVIPATKRRGLNRVAWTMRVAPPRVPRAAQVAFGATRGPRVLPGTYTVRLTRGTSTFESKLDIGLDRRAPYTAADRRAQFDAAMRVHRLFGTMSALVDRIEAAHASALARAQGLAANDGLGVLLRSFASRLEEQRRTIVATREGGAITGEERLREHTAELYGNLLAWEGRPGRYQLERIPVLERELGDVTRAVETLIATDVKVLNMQLEARKLEPIR